MKPTAAGWRVLVGNFLIDTCKSRWGGTGGGGRRAFVAIARQAGMNGYVDGTEELRDLNSLAALR